MRPRSVLIVDDNPLIRRILCEVFTREGDFEICGDARDGQDAIEKALLLKPALIVMDLSMPVLNGLEATYKLKKLMPHVPVIIFSIHDAASIEREAAAVGAAGVVSKSDPVSVLIKQSRQLAGGMAACRDVFASVSVTLREPGSGPASAGPGNFPQVSKVIAFGLFRD